MRRVLTGRHSACRLNGPQSGNHDLPYYSRTQEQKGTHAARTIHSYTPGPLKPRSSNPREPSSLAEWFALTGGDVGGVLGGPHSDRNISQPHSANAKTPRAGRWLVQPIGVDQAKRLVAGVGNNLLEKIVVVHLTKCRWIIPSSSPAPSYRRPFSRWNRRRREPARPQATAGPTASPSSGPCGVEADGDPSADP